MSKLEGDDALSGDCLWTICFVVFLAKLIVWFLFFFKTTMKYDEISNTISRHLFISYLVSYNFFVFKKNKIKFDLCVVILSFRDIHYFCIENIQY